MITPEDIIAKAQRAYPDVLRAELRGTAAFPMEISAGQAPKKDFITLRQSIEELRSRSKERLGYGYEIIWQRVQVRGVGEQTLPVRIIIETQSDYLRLLHKSREFDSFLQNMEMIQGRFPELKAWIERYPEQVIAYSDCWESLLAVCTCFRANPRPGLFIRELPIGVHTKFVETHKGILRQLLDVLLGYEEGGESDFIKRFGLRQDEPLVRFRLLDSQMQKEIHLPFDDLSVMTSAFAGFDLSPHRCLIVENKMNYLTLPRLADTFAVFGSGFRVEIIREAVWLHKCPVFYWGDIDAQGFQILSQLRGILPHTVALMMDAHTLDTYQELARTGTSTRNAELPFLTNDERLLYERLVAENLRLEQEQIDHAFALDCLTTALSGEV